MLTNGLLSVASFFVALGGMFVGVSALAKGDRLQVFAASIVFLIGIGLTGYVSFLDTLDRHPALLATGSLRDALPRQLIGSPLDLFLMNVEGDPPISLPNRSLIQAEDNREEKVPFQPRYAPRPRPTPRDYLSEAR